MYVDPIVLWSLGIDIDNEFITVAFELFNLVASVTQIKAVNYQRGRKARKNDN